jgi:hypothetical protein
MENHAELNESQQRFLLEHMPREIAELNLLKTPNTTITEIKQEVNFEMFWQHYDDKLTSSKRKTLKRWNQMHAADQVRAYNYVTKYFNSIPPGTRKKYAETYLNAELWAN